MIPPHLVETISSLPNTPGIYMYFDESGELIYVGKAKNIKKRVSSYFNKSIDDRKTKLLVSLIQEIRYTIVRSELEAFHLENNLIKQHQPKYNIRLKDGKTYPYIILTHERFPRIYFTRNLVPKKGTYFGPFTNLKAMHAVLDLIKKIFQLRNCELNLSAHNIRQGKFKKCLEYHLGNCKAPCENLQTEDDYMQQVEQIKLILDGDLRIVKKYFEQQIQINSSELNFELAHRHKSSLLALEQYSSNSLVSQVNDKIQWVFAIKIYENSAYIHYFKITYGRITQSNTEHFQLHFNDEPEDILSSYIYLIAGQANLLPDEIITNVALELPFENVLLTVPKIGDKFKLVEMCLTNIQSQIIQNISKNEPKINPALVELQQALGLKQLPLHIECFDNSNFQGYAPVSAMVCFKNGKPSKKDYRHFHVKTVDGPNDFKTMEEVVARRYLRLKEEQQPFPNLIVIDGGKGQLSAAVASLKNIGVYGEIPIIALAKRLEEIYLPGDDLPLMLSKKSLALRLLQQIRDETHRFVITFHRKTRSKKSLQ